MAIIRSNLLHCSRIRALPLGVRRCAAFALDCFTAWSRGLDERSTPEGNPLPPRRVVTLRLRAEQRRAIVIGDVHGCAAELQALLAKCGYERGRDVIVCAGDVVNKGPSSVDVVRFLRAEGAFAVRGNHEEAALAFATGAGDARSKLIAEQWSWTAELSRDDLAWLTALPFAIALPQHNAIVVHAGLVPGVALEDQLLKDLVSMRGLVPRPCSDSKEDEDDEDNESPRGGYATEAPAACPEQRWAAQWRGPELVIFGHDAMEGLQEHPYAVGLDTGCCYGNQLTALLLPGRELVSVEAARNYAGGARRKGD